LIKFDAQCANLHARIARPPNLPSPFSDGHADFVATYHLAALIRVMLQPLI
jgi:hypothetical protein